MKKSKVLLLMLCTVALSVAAVFGTLAYFTDSEAVTNTFTVGQVHISLDELDTDGSKTNVTPDSDPVRDKANEYHLIPGQTYTKDPTIHVDSKSEDCYLFVKVENGIADIEDKTKSVADQMKKLNWVKVDGVDDLYVLAKGKDGAVDYKYTVSEGAEVVVFDDFTIDGSVTNTQIAEYAQKQIVVTAYAIQAAGFDTSLDAWKTASGQFRTPNP